MNSIVGKLLARFETVLRTWSSAVRPSSLCRGYRRGSSCLRVLRGKRSRKSSEPRRCLTTQRCHPRMSWLSTRWEDWVPFRKEVNLLMSTKVFWHLIIPATNGNMKLVAMPFRVLSTAIASWRMFCLRCTTGSPSRPPNGWKTHPSWKASFWDLWTT